MRLIAVFALLGVAFGLSGCFISDDPLITPADARYPVPDGARFVRTTVGTASPGSDEDVLVRREGDLYVHEATDPVDGKKDVMRGRMTDLDTGRFVAMAEGEGGAYYIYTVFVPRESGYDEYQVTCTDLADVAKAQNKVIGDFGASHPQNGDDCKFTRLQDLKAALIVVLANRTSRDAHYAPRTP